MILSLFGPDGVGKSTLAQELANAGWFVFSGTGVASWPDQTWHKSFASQGIDETSIDSESHFLEKIQRAHQLARDLESKHGKIVIDSDPLHKTLMHDYQKTLPDTQTAKQRLNERFAQLNKIAGHTVHPLVHMYFQVSESNDTLKHAQILQERLTARGNLAYFDPRTTEQSEMGVQACKELHNLLRDKGEKVITVTTDRPFILEKFLDQLTQ